MIKIMYYDCDINNMINDNFNFTNSRRKNIGVPKIQNDCQLSIAILDFALLLPIRLSLFKLSFNHQSINKDSTKIISHFGCTNNIFLKCMYNITTQNFINKSLSKQKK